MGRKYTDEDRKRIVEEKGYELLEIVREKNNDKLFVFVVVKCKNGHIRKSRWDNFLKKDCPCYKNEEYDKKIKDELKIKGFELLEIERQNRRTYITIKCKEGHINKKVWQGINDVVGCKDCQREKMTKWTDNKIIEYIKSEKYKVIEFIKSNIIGEKRLIVQCDNEHKPYEVYFRNFLNGKRCPCCHESNGEKKISKILSNLNINYIAQYKFNDCFYKDKLRFDFYLPDYNICIEFDGGQHYEIVEWFGGLDNFINTKIRDTIKNEYCKKNNIKLIRKPYWEFDNMENIIMNELNLE